MSAQPSLFDLPPLPRKVAYRETSREAWRSHVSQSAELDYAIMEAISAEAEGIICHAIEEKIGRSHQSVSGNLRHLVERGLVEPGGHGITSSGRKAIKWRLKRIVP